MESQHSTVQEIQFGGSSKHYSVPNCENVARSTVCSLVIKHPGRFDDIGAKELADWLRRKADQLERNRKELTPTGKYTARYVVSED